MKHKLERKKAWRRKINFFTGKRRADALDGHDDDEAHNISEIELIEHEEQSTISCVREGVDISSLLTPGCCTNVMKRNIRRRHNITTVKRDI